MSSRVENKDMKIKIFSLFTSILQEKILKDQLSLFDLFFSHQSNTMEEKSISMSKFEKKNRKYIRRLVKQLARDLNLFPFSKKISDHFKGYLLKKILEQSLL